MPTLVPGRMREGHYLMTQTPEPRLRRPGWPVPPGQGRTGWSCPMACHYDPATGYRGGRLPVLPAAKAATQAAAFPAADNPKPTTPVTPATST